MLFPTRPPVTRNIRGAVQPVRRAEPSEDTGSVSVEFLGFLPLLLLVALAAVHLGLAAFAAQQAGSGARAAARGMSVDAPAGDPETVAREAMTGWVAGKADVRATACGDARRATATVSVDVPAVIPGTGFTVTRRATMPCPGRSAP
ncbi:TadE/TadG family type IV pilus assembly protein [Streptomyces sp. NPDC049577]|uniref:TadE/TadG family type IV pilus assembly protein n=1 Tax=Streptomyces sp. NPDC049577 TaxID=3155153 RepID=UPI00341899AA